MQEYDSQIAEPEESDGESPQQSNLKPLLFSSIITLVMVLIVLAVAEFYLHSAGFPYDPDSLRRPFFVDADDGMIETDPLFSQIDIETKGHKQKFSIKKPANTIRIAILGGSSVYRLGETVQGLKNRLAAAGITENIEIMNLGVCGCGTDRALISARQVLEYDLDALLVYAGHNEFISESNRETYRQPSWIQRNSKVLQLFDNPWRPEPGRLYSAAEKESTYRQYEKNLREIASLAQERKVPIVFGTVSANLVIPPKVYDAGLYQQSAVSPESGQHYKRGIGLLAEERFEEAKNAFQQSFAASDRPWRATTRNNEILRTTAAELSIPLADVEQRVIDQAPHGIPGINTIAKVYPEYDGLEGFFDDHCHLNVQGNEILLDTFAEVLIEQLQPEAAR